MILSLLETVILANAPIESDKPNKTTLARIAQETIRNPNCEVRVIMPTIDKLVENGYLDRNSDAVFSITLKGQKILKISVKELQEIVWGLPR